MPKWARDIFSIVIFLLFLYQLYTIFVVLNIVNEQDWLPILCK
jgi:hypothetical protein